MNSLQHKIMKSKDLQKFVISKYEAGQTSKKIFEDLNGAVSYRTIKRWCKMIRETGTIDLSKPFGYHRTVRTKTSTQKIKGWSMDFLQKIGAWNEHVFFKYL